MSNNLIQQFARAVNGDQEAIAALSDAAASQQTAAQSRPRRIHSAIVFTSGSARQAVALCSHAWAHRTQASMQDWYSRCVIALSEA